MTIVKGAAQSFGDHSFRKSSTVTEADPFAIGLQFGRKDIVCKPGAFSKDNIYRQARRHRWNDPWARGRCAKAIHGIEHLLDRFRAYARPTVEDAVHRGCAYSSLQSDVDDTRFPLIF